MHLLSWLSFCSLCLHSDSVCKGICSLTRLVDIGLVFSAVSSTRLFIVLMPIFCLKTIGGDQTVKIVMGALLIFVGSQTTIMGAHLCLVGAQAPTKVYKLTPMVTKVLEFGEAGLGIQIFMVSSKNAH